MIIRSLYIRVFVFSLCFLLVLFFPLRSSLEGLEFSDNIHKVLTVNGERFGFFITKEGHFLTHYDIVSDLSSVRIEFSRDFGEDAFKFRASYLESYAILKVERFLSDSEVLPLGDSDSVDIGDRVYMPGVGGLGVEAGEILFKLSYYNEYNYPCFVSSFENRDDYLGRPVFSMDEKVIGIFVSYKGNYFVLPINRVKPFVKRSLRKKGDLLRGVGRSLNLVSVRQFGSRLDYTTGLISDISFDNEHNLYFLDSAYRSLGKINTSGLYREFASGFMGEGGLLDSQSGFASGQVLGKRGALQGGGANGGLANGGLANGGLANGGLANGGLANGGGVVADVKRVSFSEPISFTITEAGLIYVLDRGEKRVIILNNALSVIEELSYEKISPLFEPIRLRAFGDIVFAETDTGKYYYLSFDSGLGKTKAILVDNALNMGDNKELKDVVYDGDNSYWLFSSFSSSTLYVMGKDFVISRIISLSESFPSSIGLYKDDIYILDREGRRVSIYNKRGDFLRYWNASLDMREGGYPVGIRISSYGVVAIVYHGFSSFALFSIDGKFMKRISSLSGGGLSFPSSLAYSAELGKLALVGEGVGLYLLPFEEALERVGSYEEDVGVSAVNGGLGTEAEGTKTGDTKTGDAKTGDTKTGDAKTGDTQVEGTKTEELVGEGVLVNEDDTGIEGGFVSVGSLFTRKVLLDEEGNNLALRGLCASGGRFFVSDVSSSLIMSFPYGSGDKLISSSYGSGLGSLAGPVQLACLDKELFVLDKGNNRVVVMGEDGMVLRSFLLKDKSSMLLYAQDIALGLGSRVFVLASNKVLTYSRDGEFLGEFVLDRGEGSYLGYAKGIAWSSGIIYVSDTYNDRILAYSEEGVLEGSFGSRGGGLDNLHRPWDIAVYGSSLYLVDRGNHRVVLYSLGSVD